MATHLVSDHLEPWIHLPGKVVMVTGASSGLGRELCLDLARAGCFIVAAARRVDRLNSLCNEINIPNFSTSLAAGRARAVAVELDVCSDGPTIEKSVKVAREAFGRIDALINNAGVRGDVKSLLDCTEEEWNNTIKTNLSGTWLVSKYVCTQMHDSGRGGSVINISSIAGVQRGQLLGGAAYAAAKMMALELGVFKIRVNCIAPGLFRSEITENLIKKDWLQNVAMRTVPLRTFGTSNPALTSLARYLIHEFSEYVSGNIFIVDAGTTLAGIPIFSSL